jgi:hypothetical protein
MNKIHKKKQTDKFLSENKMKDSWIIKKKSSLV